MLNDFATAGFIAYKSILRGSRSTFALMMVILCLSFFNMLFIPAVFSGLLSTIISLEVNTYTSHLMIGPQKEPTPKQFINGQHELRGAIKTVPGVIETARTYLSAASISFDKDKNGVFKSVSAQVIGLDPSESEKILTLKEYVVAGAFLDDDDTDKVVLSAAIAGGYNLPQSSDLGGARPGDKVVIVYGNGVQRTYTVKGITNILFGPALTNMYITAKEAESVLGASNQATQVLVRVEDQGKVDYYKSRLQTLFPNLHVQTYFDLITAIKPVLDAFKVIAIIVSVISVLIAAITIFVMIYINAVSKRRQIGILKAIGIKERIIVISYILQSLFFVVCGILVGLVFVFGVLNPLLAAHPITLPFGPLMLTFSAMLVIESICGFLVAGFLAGLIPSRIVAREEILDAIWG